MYETTTSVTDLLKKITKCLNEDDRDAAGFLADGVREEISLHGGWLTEEEQALIDSL